MKTNDSGWTARGLCHSLLPLVLFVMSLELWGCGESTTGAGDLSDCRPEKMTEGVPDEVAQTAQDLLPWCLEIMGQEPEIWGLAEAPDMDDVALGAPYRLAYVDPDLVLESATTADDFVVFLDLWWVPLEVSEVIRAIVAVSLFQGEWSTPSFGLPAVAPWLETIKDSGVREANLCPEALVFDYSPIDGTIIANNDEDGLVFYIPSNVFAPAEGELTSLTEAEFIEYCQEVYGEL